MFEETLARLRTHHKNVQRYRQLLETSLTDFERDYIGKRLSEEQASIEALSANVQTDLFLRSAPNLSDGTPEPSRANVGTPMQRYETSVE